CINAVSPARTRPNLCPATTWWWTVRIISRRDISLTMCVFLRTNRTCTARYFVLRDRLPCSRLTWADHATAVCFQSHLRPILCQTARRQECSVFCRELSGC